jgi:hypothetical protein
MEENTIPLNRKENERKLDLNYFTISLVVIVILAVAISSMEYAFAYPSPLKQFKSGILAQDVQCNNDLRLVIKLQDNSPRCVKPSSIARLVSYGWTLESKSETAVDVPQKINLDNTTLGIIVVPYFEPTSSEWSSIYHYADLYPNTIRYVIINPCSGPCSEPLSKEWQDVIFILKSKGIKTLGYIFDNSQSIINIDYYMKNPDIPTDGIFFDNEGTKDNLAGFKQYADYVHTLDGIVYINPGYNYPHIVNYIKSGYVDITNIHEIEAEKSHYILANYHFHPSKLSVILGNISTTQEMKAKLSEMASNGIGTVYLYNASYYTLPPFFAEEVQSASITPIKKP